MQLFIKLFDEKTGYMTCDQNISYNELKQLICRKFDLWRYVFQIVKGGKYLESKYDDLTISINNMNITDGCTLFLKENVFPPVVIQ